jgi:hypothetical protein
MKRLLTVIGVMLWLPTLARAQVSIDYSDAAFFHGYTASGTYASCAAPDVTTYATPADGAPFTVRPCSSSSTTTLQQAFTIPFNWPTGASVSAGTCTFGLSAVNPASGTATTTWDAAIACCEAGTADCTSKTFGTEVEFTLTDVATANAATITATSGAVAPAAYTNLAAGTGCNWRVVRKDCTGGSCLSNATVVNVKSAHVVCQ